MLYIIKVSGDIRVYTEVIKEDEYGMMWFTNRIKRHKDVVIKISNLELEFLSEIMNANKAIRVDVRSNTYKQNNQLLDILMNNIDGASKYRHNPWNPYVLVKEGYEGYNVFDMNDYFQIEKTEIFNTESYLIRYNYDTNKTYVYMKTNGQLEKIKISTICEMIPQSLDAIFNYGDERGINLYSGTCINIDDRYIFEYNNEKYVIGRNSQIIKLSNDFNGVIVYKDYRFYNYEISGVPAYYMIRTSNAIYIQDEILEETLKIVRFYSEGFLPIKKDIEINYITQYKTDTGVMLEYIHNKRLNRFNGEYEDRELRDKFAYRASIAKVLNMIFSLPEATLYTIARNIDYNPNDVSRLKIVDGKDITKYYNEANNVLSGTLGSSCMRHKSCQSYFGIYEDNAKMLIQTTQDNKIDLRALIWELTNNKTGEKIKLIDRIYYSNEKDINKIRAWADSNGYYYIECNSYSQTWALCKDKRINLGDYHIQILNKHYEKYPFLDTFYIRMDDKLYTNIKYLTLRSTSGGYSRS